MLPRVKSFLLWFLSSAFLGFLHPDAARLLALSFGLCVGYGGKGGSREGGCKRQSSERQEKPFHGDFSLCDGVQTRERAHRPNDS